MPRLTNHNAALLRILLVGAVTSLVILLLRYQLIEPDDVGRLCTRAGAPAWCGIRQLIVLGFAWNAYGWASLLFSVMAMLTRWNAAAVAGMIMGITGILFYRYFPAGLGLLLSALTLARLRAPPATGSARQQHA